MSAPPRSVLGSLIEQAREHNKLTYQEIAEACGATRPAVKAWAQGRALPEDRYTRRLARAIGHPEWIVLAARLLDQMSREGRRHEQEVGRLARALEALERKNGPLPNELGLREPVT